MTIKEAHKNLLQVLANGRIDMPNGPLTGQEHAILQQGLQLLHTKALDAKELEKENKVLKDSLLEDDIKGTEDNDE